MPVRRTNRPRWVVAGAFGAAVALLPPGASGAPVATRTPTVATPAVTTAARTVTLPTGERVAVRTGPAGRVVVAPEGGPYREWMVGGDLYVAPVSAARLVATEPGGFDVSASLRGGAPPARTVQPRFPMRTVTLDVTDDQGGPAALSQLLVVNVDDGRRYQGAPVATGGVAKISVPDGHYGLSGNEDVVDAQGDLTAERVVFGDFTVDGGAVTVPVDFRTATDRVSVATPRSAVPVAQDLVWYRGSSDADSVAGTIGGLPGDVPLYLGTSAGTYGVQHLAVRQRLESPAGTAHPYLYDVRFPTGGAIGADQSYRVRPATLATVDTTYTSDVPDRVGVTGYAPLLPWEQFSMVEDTPVTQPVRRTEYLTALPGQQWMPELWTTVDWDYLEQMWGGSRVYRPGQHTAASWQAGPVAPGLPADTGVGYYGCSACRADDELSVSVSPLTDAEPDHFGDMSSSGAVTSTGHVTLYENGVRVVDGSGSGVEATVTPDPADYRLVYDQTRLTAATHLNTGAHVEWTFRSQHSGSGTVPSRWVCATDHPDDCSAVSLLTLGYRLPQGIDGSIRPGPGTLRLTVAHTSGTPAVPVRDATLAVSFDRGRHWMPATLTRLHDGTFAARWTTPTTGGTVSLRASAADASGATISETLLDAVAVRELRTGSGSR